MIMHNSKASLQFCFHSLKKYYILIVPTCQELSQCYLRHLLTGTQNLSLFLYVFFLQTHFGWQFKTNVSHGTAGLPASSHFSCRQSDGQESQTSLGLVQFTGARNFIIKLRTRLRPTRHRLLGVRGIASVERAIRVAVKITADYDTYILLNFSKHVTYDTRMRGYIVCRQYFSFCSLDCKHIPKDTDMGENSCSQGANHLQDNNCRNICCYSLKMLHSFHKGYHL